VRIITAPGNDDPYEVDDLIRERGGDRVVLMEGEVTEIAPGHEMLSTGWSNHTPWNTHREFDEPVIREHIDAMASRLVHPEAAIFNIHVPPYDTTLDTAPVLDETFTVQTSMGNQLMAPVGSTAVREAIEAHQPLASLHGHIHESGGSVRIGRTVAINAGSEYGEGVLRGVLFTDFGFVESRVSNLAHVSWRQSVGFGFRITLPIFPAPIALDFGWPILKERDDRRQVFSFSVGFGF